jgi:hypothetical protein
MTNEQDDYAAEWEQLDQKVILAQILTELQQIRLALTDAETGASDDAGEPTAYRCRKCQTTVPADARADHARNAHKAPPAMADGMFTAVE